MNVTQRAKVLVAMSGGVDSAVAAALLQDDGYEVVGCFMRLGTPPGRPPTSPPASPPVQTPDPCDTSGGGKGSWGGGGSGRGCCSVNDAADARLVAAILDIPLYVMNFRNDFGRIIDYFVHEYNAGRTPNPCVRCNDWLKFGKLLDYAASIDADYVATGHYARIARVHGHPQLLRGCDSGKDQSYVLFGTKQDRLERMLLPIGAYHKRTIRQIAEDRKLPVFDKPDSQEICFVPDNDYARLVKQHSDDMRDGDILDHEGHIVGRHGGHQHFTIGQRRGVGVALGYPIYVTHRDPRNNTITVGTKADLMSIGLHADQTNWLIAPPRDHAMRCTVTIRYNSPPTPARVRAEDNDTLTVSFDQPIDAVTPGQAVVCYDGDRVIGGGWITAALRVSSDDPCQTPLPT